MDRIILVSILLVALYTASGFSYFLDKFHALKKELEASLRPEHELVKTYRVVSRDIRDMEHQVKEEINIAAERSAVRVHPSSGHPKSGISQYDFDVKNVHRAQRVRKVRELWSKVDHFYQNYQKDKEVIDSILEGTQDAYCIDAKDLNLRIPDLLLRECEHEIQRRNVDNVYKGGKLNLVSLVHLWNLGLHLYIEKLHEVGLPNFDKVMPKVNTQVRTQQAHLTNTQHLRSKLKNSVIPQMKEEIRILRDKLNGRVFHAKSPDSIRMTSLGIGFMPPTPPVNFSAEGADPSLVPNNDVIRMPPEQVSTPEAASVLMDSINTRLRSQEASKLVQGTPVFAKRLATQGQPLGKNIIPSSSRLPVRGSSNKTVHVTSKSHTGHQPHGTTSGQGVRANDSGTTLVRTKRDMSDSARAALVAQVSSTKQQSKHSNKRSENNIAGTKGPTSAKKDASSSVVPKVQRHKSPKAWDILADQIADSVIDGTETANFRHVIGGSDFDLDAQAFVSKDILMRTPPNQSPRSQDSLGPLSSTRLEANSDIEHGHTESIATKLFTDDGSDEDDGTGSFITLTSEHNPRPPPSSQRRQHPSGCESDESTPQKPLPTGSLLSHTSPTADRVRDMGASHSPLPHVCSLTMTSEALVMTGNLLGMTEDDHLSSVKKPVQRADWGSVDTASSGNESNTEHLGPAQRVAELPESTDTDSAHSSLSAQGGHVGIHIYSEPASGILEQNNNNSATGRDVIGAELEDLTVPPAAQSSVKRQKYTLSDPESDESKSENTTTASNDALPGFTIHRKVTVDIHTDNKADDKSTTSTEMDEYQELVNASARVIELQDGSFSEQAELTTTDPRPVDFDDIHDEHTLRGFSRNQEGRGSFRDVEHNVLQSFVNSSLHPSPLSQRKGLSAETRRSPVRSHSPAGAAADLNVADILTKYRAVMQKRAAAANANYKASSPSPNACSQNSSPSVSRTQTPEPVQLTRTPVLSERYLQRTPTKDDHKMTKRFSLNLDGDNDDSWDMNANVNNTPPQRSSLGESENTSSNSKHFQFVSPLVSPLVSPEMDHAGSATQQTSQSQQNVGATPPQQATCTPGVGEKSQFSPILDQLLSFDLEPSGRMSIDNIFNEQGPALVPMSPPLLSGSLHASNQQSPRIVNTLIDL